MLLQLCHPLESTEAPEAVREVWVMVDEYMLTEAEVSFIKLLETLDKTAQHNSSAVNSSQPKYCQSVSDLAVADTDGTSLAAEENSSSKLCTGALSSSSSSSSSSASVLEETFVTKQSDTLINACSTEPVFHSQNDSATAFSINEQEGCHHAAAPSQSQAHEADQADCQGPGQHWGLGERQCQGPSAKSPTGMFEPSSNSQAHRPLHLHSSGSRQLPVLLHMHNSTCGVPRDHLSSKVDSCTKQASYDAIKASTAHNTGEGASRLNSDQQRRAAACTLLCNPRSTLQDRGSPGLDSSMGSASEPCDDQREAGISNMQMLIMKAKVLQVRVGVGGAKARVVCRLLAVQTSFDEHECNKSPDCITVFYTSEKHCTCSGSMSWKLDSNKVGNHVPSTCHTP